MIRREIGCACIAVLSTLTASCSGPNRVILSYEQGTYPRKVSPVRVGVYYLDDQRPGWPATAAMRMFDGTHGKSAGMRHTKSEKVMNVFVAESLRAELAASGMKVSTVPEFNRRPATATPDGAGAAGVDRVVFGRINYFGFVGPVPDTRVPVAPISAGIVGGAIAGAIAGYAASARRTQEEEGVTFGDEAPGGKSYVDIDLWVVESSTGSILWAGTARGKRNSGIFSGEVADRVATFLSDALCDAFREVIARADFLAAMGATFLPARTAAQVAQAPEHERKANQLFQSGRFAEAAADFQKAYQAGGDPEYLRNVALSYRRAGNAKLALAAYEDYLRRAPGSPQRAVVEAHIKALKQQLEASKPAGQ